MKAAACLWKVHGLEQRVAVIICAIRCLHLQLSCKWGRKKGEAAVLGLCLSLLAESLANEDFFLHLKKKINFFKTLSLKTTRGCIRGVVAPPSSFHPCCPAPWEYVAGSGAAAAASCAVQLHVQKCLPRLFLLMLLPVQTWQSFGLTTPPVSQLIFYFQWTLKFSKQKELFFFVLIGVCWGFFKCSRWRSCNILEHHSHTYSHHQRLTVKGAGRPKAESRAGFEPLRVMSLRLVEVMVLRGIAGHPCIPGLVQTPSFLDCR